MEQLATSCEKAMEYPKNLIYHNIYEHSTNAYFDRLNEQQGRLLYDEKDKSAMDFWERDVQARGTFGLRFHYCLFFTWKRLSRRLQHFGTSVYMTWGC